MKAYFVIPIAILLTPSEMSSQASKAGHFLTKARRYSFTFGYLRSLRVRWRRSQLPPGTDADIHAADVDDAETTLVIGDLSFAGIGWQSAGDAMLADTSAALAREREHIGRREAADLHVA